MQLVVGRICRPHGVRGEVVVEVRTDEPDRRLARGATLATDPAGAGPLTVRSARPHAGRLLVSFEDVCDRTSAGELRGVLLVVESTALLPAGGTEDFRDDELTGLVAVDIGGGVIGRVAGVRHLPGQELLVVRPESGREVLVPFVAAIVPGVDVEGGRLVVDPPPGLLDLQEE